jgi:hypothetical protein
MECELPSKPICLPVRPVRAYVPGPATQKRLARPDNCSSPQPFTLSFPPPPSTHPSSQPATPRAKQSKAKQSTPFPSIPPSQHRPRLTSPPLPITTSLPTHIPIHPSCTRLDSTLPSVQPPTLSPSPPCPCPCPCPDSDVGPRLRRARRLTSARALSYRTRLIVARYRIFSRCVHDP